MPELPEVETIVRDIGPGIAGREITRVEVRWERSIYGASAEELNQALVGRRVKRVHRRAKFIIMDLSDGNKFALHLAMTGRLLLRPSVSPEDRSTRIVFTLDNGQEIRFADARKFGRVRLLTPEEYQIIDQRLGPEPLSEGFTLDQFRDMLGRKGTRIKQLLLDQQFIAGIGNIYADEALFEAGIHPTRPARSLSSDEIDRLYHSVRRVLTSGIRDRGTTFESYVDAFGRIGGHQSNLSVYRRAGKPCPRCGTAIERQIIGGRSSHFCPKCQPVATAPAS